MAALARKVKVDITSDVLCPFCLLGVRQLELAIAKYREQEPSVDFDLRFHPFQLNGLLTEQPTRRRDYGEKKFGAERWKEVNKSLQEKFRAVGIDYAMDSEMSSSHLAHRLQQYALTQKPEVQKQVAMDVFELYHVKGIHPSDRDALATIAVKNQLFTNTAEARAWLDGTGCDLEVKKAYQSAQRMGITGVPFFVFQDKYAASGAMGVDEFVGIIGEISKREQEGRSPPPVPMAGEMCAAA